MKVGFVGLGAMGHAMAERLLKGGHELVVTNRTRAKADDLVAQGAVLPKRLRMWRGRWRPCSPCCLMMRARKRLFSGSTELPRLWRRAVFMRAAVRCPWSRRAVCGTGMRNMGRFMSVRMCWGARQPQRRVSCSS